MTSIKAVTATETRPAMVEQTALRPALRPVKGVEFPPGRTHLPWGWWDNPDWLPGSAVTWRDQWITKRAKLRAEGKVRKRYDPDKNLRTKLRGFAEHRWDLVHRHGQSCPPDWIDALSVMQ